MLVRAGGANQTITGARAFVSGAWRPIIGAKAYVDGAWRVVGNFTSGAGSISLSLSPTTITKTGRNNATVTSTQVVAIPTGGQTPYTYAWVKQSGDDISATAPAASSTQFRATNMEIDETRTAVFRCTATDAFANSDSEDITVTIIRLEPIDIGGNQ